MKNISNDKVMTHILEWENKEEQGNALQLLDKMDKANKIILGKPSAIAIAFLYHVNKRKYGDYLDFYKTRGLSATEATIRGHVRKIKEFEGEITR